MTKSTTRGKNASDTTRPLRFPGYALPSNKDSGGPSVTQEGFSFETANLGALNSFLDYDGVLLLAGAYEGCDRNGNLLCLNQADLDAREREFSSLYEQGKPIIFLIQPQSDIFACIYGAYICDLFKRVAARFRIQWRSLVQPHPALKSAEAEFGDYMGRFGAGYVLFDHGDADAGTVRTLFEGDDGVFGLTVNNRVFFLPCVIPKAGQVDQIALAAILATIKYRERLSSELPTWTVGFSFEHESELRREQDAVLRRAAELETELNVYRCFKGALCWQSEPLVSVVKELFNHFFGIDLVLEDKYVEDATVRGPNGEIQAVIEIKGVKGNFTRGNVGQVDSHRERLGLPANTPGILIMNTLMNSDSLSKKDGPPHPDIIRKAAADRVLLIRTLDLLRYANAVQGGTLTQANFRETILRESGWLRVNDGKAEAVRS